MYNQKGQAKTILIVTLVLVIIGIGFYLGWTIYYKNEKITGEVWVHSTGDRGTPTFNEFYTLRTIEGEFGYYGLSGELLGTEEWERFKKETKHRTIEIVGEETEGSWPSWLSGLPSLGFIKMEKWEFVRPKKLIGIFKIAAKGSLSEYRIFETVRGKVYVVSSTRGADVPIPEDTKIKIMAEPASEVWYIPFGPEPEGFITILQWETL